MASRPAAHKYGIGKRVSRASLSGLAALSTAVALVVLWIEVDENSVTRDHLWILVAMIDVSLAIETVDRGFTGRKLRWVGKTNVDVKVPVDVH